MMVAIIKPAPIDVPAFEYGESLGGDHVFLDFRKIFSLHGRGVLVRVSVTAAACLSLLGCARTPVARIRVITKMREYLFIVFLPFESFNLEAVAGRYKYFEF